MKRFKISYIFGIPKAHRDQEGKNKEARNKKRREKENCMGFRILKVWQLRLAVTFPQA